MPIGGRYEHGAMRTRGSRSRLHFIATQPTAMAVGCFNAVPILRNDFDEDGGPCGERGERRSAVERRGSKCSTWIRDANFESALQFIGALLKTFQRSLRIAKASGFIIAFLCDRGRFRIQFALLQDLRGLLRFALNRDEVRLNFSELGGLDGSVGSVDAAGAILHEYGGDLQMGARGGDGLHDVPDVNRADIRTVLEMSRRERAAKQLVEDLAVALVCAEIRVGVFLWGAIESGFPLIDLGSMNDGVLDHGVDGFGYVAGRRGQVDGERRRCIVRTFGI